MPTEPQLIVVTNESTVLTDDTVANVIPAMQEQLSGDFADVWQKTARLEFVPKGELGNSPADAWQMIVLDNSDQAGAIGYHTETATGQPMGKVFAGSDLAYNTSWTVTLSHELLEIVADPYLVFTATYTMDDGSIVVASVEVGDAVEDDSLAYKIGDVLVSDWCTPSWWGLDDGTTYDLLGHASTPFNPANPAQGMPRGGYLAIWTPSAGWNQVMGADRAEDPHALPVPGSRRERRIRGQYNWVRSVSPDEVAQRRESLLSQQA